MTADDMVTMVGADGRTHRVDRETAEAATGLLKDIETRMTAAYEQGKEVGRVNGAARLDEMKSELAQARLDRAEFADENERLRNHLAGLDRQRHAEVQKDRYEDTATLLGIAREQRDALYDVATGAAADFDLAVPCGDGRCYCGGCAL